MMATMTKLCHPYSAFSRSTKVTVTSNFIDIEPVVGCEPFSSSAHGREAGSDARLRKPHSGLTLSSRGYNSQSSCHTKWACNFSAGNRSSLSYALQVSLEKILAALHICIGRRIGIEIPTSFRTTHAPRLIDAMIVEVHQTFQHAVSKILDDSFEPNYKSQVSGEVERQIMDSWLQLLRQERKMLHLMYKKPFRVDHDTVAS